MASIQNDRARNSIETIIAISVIIMLASVMSNLPTGVYAQGGAYRKGYDDALCDAALCNGHGYNSRCPGNHSSEFCSNYRDGYAAGWAASKNANGNSNSTSQGSVKGYWTADDATIPSNMRAYHIFVDGLDPLWAASDANGRKNLELTYDGLQVGLKYGETFTPVIFHKITVAPAAVNSTVDAGFFVVPKSLNEGKMWVMLKTKYLDAENGHPLSGSTYHIDIDLLYEDIISYRACVENYHLKPGTDKFHECYEGLS